MYSRILKKYKAVLTGFPDRRRPRVGAVIREMRINQGMTQADMSAKTGIHKATISAFENDHQRATSIENLEKYTARLGASLEEIILLGREYDPCNAFILKKTGTEKEASENIDGLSQRKHETRDWFASLRLRMPDFDVIPISPPLAFRKDFFVARFLLPPKRQIRNLVAGPGCPVTGVISSGFDLRVTVGGQSFDLGGAQSFRLDGSFPHTISNDNDNHTAIFYLLTRVPFGESPAGFQRPSKTDDGKMNIARALETLRCRLSRESGSPVPLRRMAAMSDTLHEKQIREMTRLKKESSVVYWEKIEDLLGATQTPLEDFLRWSRGTSHPGFSVSSTLHQAVITYGQHGVQIKTRNPLDGGKDFFCGVLDLEGVGGKGQKPRIISDWYRKDDTVTALFVEYGHVRLVVGKRKKVYDLGEGDSAYLDTGLGFSIRNRSAEDSRMFLATSPALPI